MARPTKFTPAVKAQILDGVRAGLTFEDAAAFAGISRNAFLAWRKENPEFADEVATARAQKALRMLVFSRQSLKRSGQLESGGLVA